MNEIKAVAPKKMPPSLHLDGEDLPELENAKMGQAFTLTIKAKVTSLSRDNYDGKNKLSGTLEIQSINDQDFEEKSYDDIMKESPESQDEGSDNE